MLAHTLISWAPPPAGSSPKPLWRDRMIGSLAQLLDRRPPRRIRTTGRGLHRARGHPDDVTNERMDHEKGSQVLASAWR
jgi:hypothetical protein